MRRLVLFLFIRMLYVIAWLCKKICKMRTKNTKAIKY